MWKKKRSRTILHLPLSRYFPPPRKEAMSNGPARGEVGLLGLWCGVLGYSRDTWKCCRWLSRWHDRPCVTDPPYNVWDDCSMDSSWHDILNPEGLNDFMGLARQVMSAGNTDMASARRRCFWTGKKSWLLCKKKCQMLKPTHNLRLPWGGQYLKWNPLCLTIPEPLATIEIT